MPAELLKFRCYSCNQLLAVAPSRAGSVVGCPRCKAELQIPGGESVAKPEVQKAARRQRAGSVALDLPPSQSNAPEIPEFMAGIAAAIPPEVAELRPEDLRVEAEVFESITREPAPPPAPEPMPAPAIQPPPPVFPLEARKPEPSPAELSNLFAPAVQPSEPTPAPAQPQPLPTESRAFVPPIEIEPPSILAAGTEIRRPLEVILPASVVLAWSVFVLVGIALSFIAGLLVGHFLWKVH